MNAKTCETSDSGVRIVVIMEIYVYSNKCLLHGLLQKGYSETTTPA